MPIPVSSTASVTHVRPPPSGAVLARTVTLPRSVNLSALPSKLNRIWRTRVASPISVSSDPGSTAPVSMRPLAMACAWNVLSTPSIKVESENGAASSSSRPASILEKSSTSSMMRNSACAESRMVSTVRCWLALSPCRSSTSIMPSTPFIDRKSTRLNSSHSQISYAVFCLKKKNENTQTESNKMRLNNPNQLDTTRQQSPIRLHGSLPRTLPGTTTCQSNTHHPTYASYSKP